MSDIVYATELHIGDTIIESLDGKDGPTGEVIGRIIRDDDLVEIDTVDGPLWTVNADALLEVF